MAKPPGDETRDPQASRGSDAIAEFQVGSRAAFEALYRDNFAVVDRAVGQVLAGADKETVVHEVFLRLMTSEPLRLGFRGGSLAAWLTTVARNQAIDYHRRRRFEQPGDVRHDEVADGLGGADELERRAEARILVERFRREHLPPKWAPVFELRFLQQLEQQQAAEKLGMHRTTLAHQEYRIRALLKRFLLRLEKE